MGFIGNLKKLVGAEKKPVKRRKPARTKTVTKQKPQKKSVEHVTLAEWKTMMKELQNHPLTQAKVVNQQMMESMMGILENMNEKLDTVNVRLDRLEGTNKKILDEQKSQKSEIKRVKQDQKQSTEKQIKEVGKNLKLSKSEKKILELMKTRKNIQAGDLAPKLKISRSNVSLKLNKLYSINLVTKFKEGKDTFYSLK